MRREKSTAWSAACALSLMRLSAFSSGNRRRVSRLRYRRGTRGSGRSAAPASRQQLVREGTYQEPDVGRAIGGERLFTFLRYPPEQWRSLRTTNAIERLHEEFKRQIRPSACCPVPRPPPCCSGRSWRRVRLPCAASMAGRPSSAHPPTLTSPPDPPHHAPSEPRPPISTNFATRLSVWGPHGWFQS